MLSFTPYRQCQWDNMFIHNMPKQRTKQYAPYHVDSATLLVIKSIIIVIEMTQFFVWILSTVLVDPSLWPLRLFLPHGARSFVRDRRRRTVDAGRRHGDRTEHARSYSQVGGARAVQFYQCIPFLFLWYVPVPRYWWEISVFIVLELFVCTYESTNKTSECH